MLFFALALADPLAAEGEAVGGATVETVELHPEFQRYWLRFPTGELYPAEVTSVSPGNTGLCRAGAVDLYPRQDLAEGVPADTSGPMGVLCQRLAAAPPVLGPIRGGSDTRVVTDFHDDRRPFVPLLLHPLVAAVVLGGLALIRRPTLEVVIVGAVAVLARLGPGRIFNGEGAAAEKISLAWGVDLNSPYGAGYPAIFGPVLAVIGRGADEVYAVNRVIGALAPVLLCVLGTRLGGRAVGLGAGLLLAVWPAHVRLSTSEAMHVSVVTLLLLALVAADRGRLGAVVAGLAAGLAAHVRPEAVLVPLPLMLLTRWYGSVLAVALAGWAAMALDLDQGVLRWDGGLLPVLLHPDWTPPFLWAFVLIGLVAVPARVRWLALVWWLALEAPVLPKTTPLADPLRLQLPTAPLWALLAGFGAAAVHRWMVYVPALGAAAWLTLRPGYAVWAEHDAFDRMRRAPVEGVVLFDDSATRAEKVQRVRKMETGAAWARGGPWLAGEDARGPSMVWRDVACEEPRFDAIASRCRLSLVEEWPVTQATDRPMCVRPVVALYRVVDCG